MKKLRGKVAAVTGAASGIGRMLAINLAKKGCNLAITDVNEEGLQETKKMIGNGSVNVTTHIVDASNREQVYAHAEEVVNTHGQVDIVINNAGVSVANTIENMSYEDFEWVININFWGVVYGTKAFLPHLMKRPEANIVNLSSITTFLPFPNNAPYNCSKSAVKAFNESLTQELRHTPIKITSVLPGFIRTNIVRSGRFHQAANHKIDKERHIKNFDKFSITSVDKAARIIISGLIKNKKQVLVGLDAKIYDKLTRLFPKGMIKFLAILGEKTG